MLINFLKELPDRYLILICFGVLIAVYLEVRNDAVLQLMINFGVAIIALSTKLPPKSTVTADTVQTDNLNADSMPDTTVHATNLNVKK